MHETVKLISRDPFGQTLGKWPNLFFRKSKFTMYITITNEKSHAWLKKTQKFSNYKTTVVISLRNKQIVSSQLLSISSYVKFYLLTIAVFPS